VAEIGKYTHDCGCGCDCDDKCKGIDNSDGKFLTCSNLFITSNNGSVGITKSGNCLFDLAVNPSQIPFLRQNSSSIIFNGDGRVTPLVATAKISQASGNALSILSDGLYSNGLIVETDALALSKHVSISPGAGIFVVGNITQNIGSNPSYSIGVIPSFITSLFSAGAGISYNNVTGVISSTITQYTNELAQDAVAGALVDSSSIAFNYDDTANQITAFVKDSYLYARFLVVEIRFKVGDTGAPQSGESLFTLRDCNNNIIRNAKLDVYRERDLQYIGDDYTYDETNGSVVVSPAFGQNERVVVKAYPKAQFQTCQVGQAAETLNNHFTYTLSFNLA
jgi:hypothetical protein